MTKREKVLLGVMGAAALVAAGVFVLTGPGKGARTGPDKTVAAAKSNADAQDMALRPWSTVVFYDKALDIKTDAGKGELMPAFTGYVELGALRLAIIDGYEYREGDELETGGFLVDEVKPTQVTLRGIDTGKLLRLPYQDPSFFTQ